MKVRLNASSVSSNINTSEKKNQKPVWSAGITNIRSNSNIICPYENNAFEAYLNDYPDELPYLRCGQYEVRGDSDPNLNCHCYAVRSYGYAGPADGITVGMDVPDIEAEVTKWFINYDYRLSDRLSGESIYNRDIRNERVILFGITPAEARDLLAMKKRLSPPLKSTLALAMNQQSGTIYPTHSIRQNLAGGWESKMGSGPAIHLATPSLLSGGVYGQPYLMFEKKRVFG